MHKDIELIDLIFILLKVKLNG